VGDVVLGGGASRLDNVCVNFNCYALRDRAKGKDHAHSIFWPNENFLARRSSPQRSLL
jgi:hypothetical protein